MAQITLNSTGVASNGTLALQSNGTTTAVTIDASQNVGIGTVSPGVRLEVSGASAGSSFNALRLANTDTTAGSPVSTLFQSADDGTLRNRAIISSGSDGSNNGYVAFSTRLSGSVAERMRLDASGNLGVGETSPTFRISIKGDTSVKSGMNFKNTVQNQELQIGCSAGSTDSFFNTTSNSPIYFGTNNIERARITSGGALLVAKNTTNDGDTGFMFEPIRDGAGNGRLTITQSATTNSGVSFSAYSSGASAYRFYVGMGGTIFATSTTISAISDIRYKENVRDLNVGLAEVMALKPRLYDWKEGKGADIKNARGFIAQEFEEVFPDLIDEWKDPAPEGEDPYKSVRADLIPVLVKSIQELKAIVDAQAVEIAALKGTA